MKQLIALVAAGFAIVNGFRVLLAEECSSVSFRSTGGRYASSLQCYSDGSGGIPAWLAGGGLILLGLLVLALLFRSRRTPKY